MSFKINRGRDAITQTRTVVDVLQPGTPDTVTVTLGMHEALVLAALQGRSNGVATPTTLFRGLRDHRLYREYSDAVRQALGDNGEYGKNVNLWAVESKLRQLRDEVDL